MSSSKVRTLKTQIKYTATWNANILTVTTASNHNLASNDVVKLLAASGNQDNVNHVVTVTSATTFTTPSTDKFYSLVGLVEIPFFRTGITGRQIFTSPHSTGTDAVIQSYVSGTGGAVYTIDQSLDGIHWTPSGITVTHGTSDQDTQGNALTGNWAYLAANITSIGVATALTVMYSA